MREIAFRVWAEEAKEMVYFDLRHDFTAFRDDVQQTVMQFTGLFNEKGDKIWEGDIIQSEDKLRKWVVEYSTSQGGRYIGRGLGRTWTNNLPPFFNLEVIGNVYENPEMVKK